MRPGVPKTFDAIVRKAIAKDPAERYQSVGDLAGDLLWAKAGEARRRGLWVAAVAGVVAIAVVGAAVWFRMRVGPGIESGGARPHIEQITAEDLLGSYPAVRYYPPTGDLYLDVLTRLGDAARFETIEAEIKILEGTSVRVATPAALYRLKRGTLRSKDHQDAAALRERFNLKDEA